MDQTNVFVQMENQPMKMELVILFVRLKKNSSSVTMNFAFQLGGNVMEIQ
jgi:hypothetical protein